jgi:hypothetical protein
MVLAGLALLAAALLFLWRPWRRACPCRAEGFEAAADAGDDDDRAAHGDAGDYEGDGSSGGHGPRGGRAVAATVSWCIQNGHADADAVLAVLPQKPAWAGSALASEAAELRLLVAKVVCVPDAAVAPGGAAAAKVLLGDARLPFVPTHDADAPAQVVATCHGHGWRPRDVRRAVAVWAARGAALIDALGVGVHADAGTLAAAHAALRRLLSAAADKLTTGCIARRLTDGDAPAGPRDPAWSAPSLLSWLGEAPPEAGVPKRRAADLRASGLEADAGTRLSARGVDDNGTGDAAVPRQPAAPL